MRQHREQRRSQHGERPAAAHVSGSDQLVARDLVEYRKNNGPFQTRDQLLQVPYIPARHGSCIGLGFPPDYRRRQPARPHLDSPDSYPIARQLLGDLGYGPEALEEKDKVAELQEKLKAISPEEVANRLQVGVPTVRTF